MCLSVLSSFMFSKQWVKSLDWFAMLGKRALKEKVKYALKAKVPIFYKRESDLYVTFSRHFYNNFYVVSHSLF